MSKTVLSRCYLIALVVITAVLVLASLVVLWTNPEVYQVIFSLVPLYFAVVTLLQHFFVVRSAQKDARTFVKVFLGCTVGTLFLHLVVMSAYMFSHLHQARLFLLAFCFCYIVYIVFETWSLIRFVKKARADQSQTDAVTPGKE